MKYKKGLIFICLIICLFSIASVCASEINETVVASDGQSDEILTVEDNNDIVTYDNQVNGGNLSVDSKNVDGVGATEENELSTTPGTFTDLAKDIENAGDELNLTKNYICSDSDNINYGINIDKNIKINGNGFTINGNGKSSVFNIYSVVTLNNISFINCNRVAVSSGYDAITTITNCCFENNNYGYNSGAIYTSSTICSIINCIFRNNSRVEGGAIEVKNNVVVSKCSFIDNVATRGGAIVLKDADKSNILCEIKDCNFLNNNASKYDGGAIYISNNPFSICNCYFENNSASITGGALDLSGNNSLIKNCTFYSNYAGYSGGSIELGGVNNLINACNFTKNSAKEYAGAISIGGRQNIINFSIFENNIQGAIRSSPNILINSSVFKYNSNIDGYGGAILFSSSGVESVINNCSFINNIAKKGGAIYYYLGGNSYTYDEVKRIHDYCNFINNSASDRGNAIYSCGKCDFKINACNFSGENYETNDYIYTDTKITPYIMINSKNIFVDENFNLIITIPCSKGIATICQYDDKNNCYFNKSYNMSLNNGKINYMLPNSHYGKNYINIHYSGDDVFSGKTQNFTYYVLKYPTKVFFNLNDIVWGESIILSPVVDKHASGKFRILVDNQILSIIDLGESYNLTCLDGGMHNVTIIYCGNDYYESSQLTKVLNIHKLNTTYSIRGYIERNNSATIHFALNEDATGNVSIAISGNEFTTNLINGATTFNVPNLPANTYSVTINYTGDSKYNLIYTTESLEITLKPSTITLNLDNILIGDNVVIKPIVTSSATGDIKIYVDNVLKKTIAIGSSYTIENPAIGSHSVRVVYAGDSYHQGNETKTTFRVFTFYPIEVQNSAIIYGMDKHFQAIVYDEYGNVAANKPVAFSINGEDTVVMSDSNGLAVFNKDLPIGTYYVSVINVYVNEEHTYILKVFTSIESENMTRAYNTGMDFKVKLLDENADILSRGYAIFNINNKDYPVVADNDGVAILNVNLPVGTYIVTTTNGRTGETKINKIIIVPSVEATNMVRGYNSGVDFKAKFLDDDAKPLVNQKVAFKIGFTEYESTTDANGFAVLNEQLDVGKYEVTAINKVTGEKATRNLTIVERIVENNDVIRIYGEESYYTIHVVGDDGSFVGENEVVNININNIDYQIRTNKNGYASFRIDENIGSYDILAEYKGYEVYNEVYVLQRVNYIKNLNVSNINYKQNEVVSLNLSSFDNLAYVEFEVDGDNGYKRIFDQSAGNSITLPITNLVAGKYTVTAKYYDLNTHKFSSMAKTFIINKINPKIIIVVEDANVGETATITVNIPDVEGNVEIKVGNALSFNEYLVKNGVIIKEIDSLPAGTYNVDVTYVGDNNYNRFTQSSNLTITQPKTLTKIGASDITITQGKGTTLVATLKDVYGKALVGKGVSIYFNGVNSILTTNNNGEVKLAIKDNLVPKIYDVTITFVGDEYYVESTASVKVTVNKIPVPPTPKTTLTLKTVKVKKSAKKLVLQATLKQGKNPLKNKKITFKFNGKTYKAKTNKKGIAKVTIKKKILKKLKVGKKVKYQVSYGKITVKKSVKIKK